MLDPSGKTAMAASVSWPLPGSSQSTLQASPFHTLIFTRVSCLPKNPAHLVFFLQSVQKNNTCTERSRCLPLAFMVANRGGRPLAPALHRSSFFLQQEEMSHSHMAFLISVGVVWVVPVRPPKSSEISFINSYQLNCYPDRLLVWGSQSAKLNKLGSDN